MSVELWTEKYRPRSIDEYIFRDEKHKKQCEKWIREGALPHIMLSGDSGVGKSALVGVLLRELKVPDGDVLKLNASKDNSVENIRNNVCTFAALSPLGDNFKYIWLDESDFLSPASQATLRGTIEEFHDITRFIFTCNYIHKIMPAIKGRCQNIHIETLDRDAYFLRIIEILVNEKIDQKTLNRDVIDKYIDTTFPNMRATINLLQMNFEDNILHPLDDESLQTDSDSKLKAVALFKDGKIGEARKEIVKDFRAEENDDWFRYFYDNLDFWGDTEEQQARAIIKIRDGLVKSTMCADLEINIAATLVELEQIAQG